MGYAQQVLTESGWVKHKNVTKSRENVSHGMEPKPFPCDLKVCRYLDPVLASGIRIMGDSPPGMSTLKTMIWTGAPVPRESGPIVNWCDAYKLKFFCVPKIFHLGLSREVRFQLWLPSENLRNERFRTRRYRKCPGLSSNSSWVSRTTLPKSIILVTPPLH